MADLVKKSSKNSIIELLRFLFALNVLVYHEFLPFESSYFGQGWLSVEFFFILSGFLFNKTFEKTKNMSYLDGFKTIFNSKLKPLLVPIIIGLLSNIILNIIVKYHPLKIWRYLWYIPAMMAMFFLYTVLRRLIKNDKSFFAVVLSIFIIATILRFSGNDALYSFDYIRSASMVSFGILLARLPRFEIKNKLLSWLLFIVAFVPTFLIICFRLGDMEWFGGFRGIEAILNLVLYPFLILTAFNFNVNSKILSFLGAISFGVYAYQCPARLLATIGLKNSWFLLSFYFWHSGR